MVIVNPSPLIIPTPLPLPPNGYLPVPSHHPHPITPTSQWLLFARPLSSSPPHYPYLPMVIVCPSPLIIPTPLPYTSQWLFTCPLSSSPPHYPYLPMVIVCPSPFIIPTPLPLPPNGYLPVPSHHPHPITPTSQWLLFARPLSSSPPHYPYLPMVIVNPSPLIIPTPLPQPPNGYLPVPSHHPHPITPTSQWLLLTRPLSSSPPHYPNHPMVIYLSPLIIPTPLPLPPNGYCLPVPSHHPHPITPTSQWLLFASSLSSSPPHYPYHPMVIYLSPLIIPTPLPLPPNGYCLPVPSHHPHPITPTSQWLLFARPLSSSPPHYPYLPMVIVNPSPLIIPTPLPQPPNGYLPVPSHHPHPITPTSQWLLLTRPLSSSPPHYPNHPMVIYLSPLIIPTPLPLPPNGYCLPVPSHHPHPITPTSQWLLFASSLSSSPPHYPYHPMVIYLSPLIIPTPLPLPPNGYCLPVPSHHPHPITPTSQWLFTCPLSSSPPHYPYLPMVIVYLSPLIIPTPLPLPPNVIYLSPLIIPTPLPLPPNGYCLPVPSHHPHPITPTSQWLLLTRPLSSSPSHYPYLPMVIVNPSPLIIPTPLPLPPNGYLPVPSHHPHPITPSTQWLFTHPLSSSPSHYPYVPMVIVNPSPLIIPTPLPLPPNGYLPVPSHHPHPITPTSQWLLFARPLSSSPPHYPYHLSFCELLVLVHSGMDTTYGTVIRKPDLRFPNRSHANKAVAVVSH